MVKVGRTNCAFHNWSPINGKEKYGQFAPMIGQKTWLKLLSRAIDNDYFEDDFLKKLNKKISEYLKDERS